jgi:hypothetical protein
MTPRVLTPDDVVAAAVTAEAALRPVAGRACVELLVHTDDALSGLGVVFAPPADLCQRVLAQQYPDTAGAGDSWPGLLAATGRPPRRRR